MHCTETSTGGMMMAYMPTDPHAQPYLLHTELNLGTNHLHLMIMLRESDVHAFFSVTDKVTWIKSIVRYVAENTNNLAGLIPTSLMGDIDREFYDATLNYECEFERRGIELHDRHIASLSVTYQPVA